MDINVQLQRRPIASTMPGAVVRLPAVWDALDRAIERGVPAVLAAPTGSGASTAVSAWTSEHPRMAALEVPSVTAARSVLAARGAESADPALIVVDGASSEDLIDLDALADALAVTSQAAVFVVCRDVDPSVLETRRIEIVPAHAFAWNSAIARDALLRSGIHVPPDIVERLCVSSGGRAAAIVEGAIEWRRRYDAGGRGASIRIGRMVATWWLERARVVVGSEAARLLLLVGSLGDTHDVVADALCDDGAGRETLERLARAGFLGRRAAVLRPGSVFAAPPALAPELAALASERDPDLVIAAHRLARQSRIAPRFDAYHFAREGDVARAATLVLRDWWRGGNLATDAGTAAVLALPLDVVAADPVLAALRIAVDGSRDARDESSARYEDALLTADPARLDALDVADQMLVVSSTLEVLLRRRAPSAAIARGTALADAQVAELSRLGSRERRALAALLVAVAEAHALSLEVDIALRYTRVVASLSGSDCSVGTRYRGAVVEATARFMTGERDLMVRSLLEADVYYAMSGCTGGPVQTLQRLVEGLDAVARGDAVEADLALARITAFGRPDEVIDAHGILGTALLLLRGDVASAAPRAASALGSPAFAETWPAYRAYALDVVARAFFAERRPGAVLDLLRDEASPLQHSVCFEGWRAAALLAAGHPEAALLETEFCAQASLRHAVGTEAARRIIRAASLQALGHHAAALSEFLLGVETGPRDWLPALLARVPANAVVGLSDLLVAAGRAELAVAVVAAVDRAGPGTASRGTAFGIAGVQ